MKKDYYRRPIPATVWIVTYWLAGRIPKTMVKWNTRQEAEACVGRLFESVVDYEGYNRNNFSYRIREVEIPAWVRDDNISQLEYLKHEGIMYDEEG